MILQKNGVAALRFVSKDGFFAPSLRLGLRAILDFCSFIEVFKLFTWTLARGHSRNFLSGLSPLVFLIPMSAASQQFTPRLTGLVTGTELIVLPIRWLGSYLLYLTKI